MLAGPSALVILSNVLFLQDCLGVVDGIEPWDDPDLPGQFSNLAWLRDLSFVGMAQVEERLLAVFVIIRRPNPSENQISVRSQRHCRLSRAELMSEVLRHQAVLIRAERVRRRTPVPVRSTSSRLPPGRVFQHSCRNSHGRNEG